MAYLLGEQEICVLWPVFALDNRLLSITNFDHINLDLQY